MAEEVLPVNEDCGGAVAGANVARRQRADVNHRKSSIEAEILDRVKETCMQKRAVGAARSREKANLHRSLHPPTRG